MGTTLDPQKRLIVALDPKFNETMTRDEMFSECDRILDIACEEIGETGIVAKVNTIFRVLGWSAIERLEQAGLSVFLDGKFFDIQNTIMNDLLFWRTFGSTIEICTLAHKIKPTAFSEAKRLMPDTLFCPVDPLTDLVDHNFQGWYGHGRDEEVHAFFHNMLSLKGADGVVCSARDIKHGPSGLATMKEVVAPGIRRGSDPIDDNSPNSMTPVEAIQAGARRLVVGRPIMSASNKKAVTEEIVEDIRRAA